MTRPCSPTRACWLRAWDRAKAEQLIPYRETPTTWSVKTYTVTVTGAGWSDLVCNCTAGQNRRICKHLPPVAKCIAQHISPIRGTGRGEVVVAAEPRETAYEAPASEDTIWEAEQAYGDAIERDYEYLVERPRLVSETSPMFYDSRASRTSAPAIVSLHIPSPLDAVFA
jgi:hypothetical protein